MKHRLFTISVLVVIILSGRGPVSVAAAQPDGMALVQIAWQSQADLAAVETSTVPVYARLAGDSGAYLLAGATSREIEALRAGGLDVTILDPNLRGASYYLAYAMPGLAHPDWEAYGSLLLDDGVQVLLRATPQDAERLAGAGVQLRAVTFDPKPLRPQSTGAIPTQITPDPLIQLMIDQVDMTTVYSYTGGLSGEWPVEVGGEPYTITTRNTNSGEPIQKATQFVGEHLTALGLNVEYHQWSGADYPNVIGELPGLANPDDIFIIGAHLDDMPSSGPAPGADDNASGSVATLIAADIATQYQWGCTLRFALWTGEEQGLLGSNAYAQRSYNQGENIVGYLNLDMIAWDDIGGPDIDLHAESSLPETLVLAQLFADVVSAYNLNLIPQIIPNGTGASDHASFWDFGYTAILGIEDNSDFNDYYHTSNDLLQYLNMPYYTDFVKASVGTFAHMSGCLLASGVGALDGHVTAASSGDPIADAAVTIEDNAGHAFATTTDPGGYYTQTLLSGTYTVTAEAYGYLPATVAGVVVTTDTVTTQDFALQTAPTYVVSGTVTEAGTGTPLFAQVEFQGSPETVWTDPVTGFYQATLAEGAYTMRVTADLHRSEERPIVVDHDQTQNFYLDPLPCILVVDDDNNNPDVLPYFADALDNLGYDYDVFDVGGGGGDGPDLAGLQGYNMVIWFSGDKYGGGGSAGPNGTDEAALAAYLDGGGKLFLSSQDYLYDFGLTTFGSGYLGIGSFTNDTGNANSKYGVAGDPIGDGLGPYTLSYPSGFTDYGDVVNAGAGASVAFRSSAGGGNNLDVDKDGGDWQTVFFGTSWVPVYNYNAANGEELLQRIVDWFGVCESQDGWLTGQVTDALSGDPLAGAEVTVQPSARGQILAPTDPNGYYTMTLPAGTYDVTASKAGYYPDTAVAVNVQAGMTTTQDFALQPMQAIVVEPQALEATLYPGDATTHTLWVTNTGESDLTFAVHELSRTLTLAAGPLVQPQADPVVDPKVWNQVQAEGQAEVIIHLREQADLSPAYAIRDWAERGRFVYDRLRQTAERSGGALRALLEDARAQPQVLLAANAIAATVDAPLLDAVATRPEVARVTPNREGSAIPFLPAEQEANIAAVEWNIAQIRADEAWATFGITGQGVSVGNIGTGVLYDHPALVEQYRGNLGGGSFDHNYNWYDLINSLPEPYDDNGHTTRTTGVMVGDDGGSNQIGVAPGAQWITVKAISGGGSTTEAILHSAMDWMLAPTDLNGTNPDPAQRPHLVTNAWGQMATCDPEFQPDLMAWWAAGILPVFDLWGSGPACGTIQSPSDLYETITASAVDSNDDIAPFNPAGPSLCGPPVKPEVSAPGVNIRSSYNDGDYMIWSGTSAAAAHLAGTAALVMSADPELSLIDVVGTITGTAVCIEDLRCGGEPCPDGGNNVYGWGRIDAFEAVSLTLSGVSYDIPWLSVDPAGATLGAGEGIPLDVTFDAAGLEPGAYLGLLDVESDDPVAPHVSVPLTLTVELEPFCDPVDVVTVTTEISGCAVAFGAVLTGTEPFTYAWDFGAFGTSTVPTPTIDFGASSSYPYALTAFNCNGTYSDTLSGMVTVDCGIACEPVDIVTITTEISGCAVAFGAELTGTAPYAYAWDFGAFDTSTVPTPTIDFAVSGTYPFTLTVSNCSAAYSDTMTGTVAVECAAPTWYIYLPLVVRGG